MRKLVVSAAVLAILLIGLAESAAAQRDPFEPVIDTSVSTGGGANDPAEVDPEPAIVTRSGGMADTGAATDQWLGAAYALIAMGGGIVVLTRLVAPRRAERE